MTTTHARYDGPVVINGVEHKPTIEARCSRQLPPHTEMRWSCSCQSQPRTRGIGRWALWATPASVYDLWLQHLENVRRALRNFPERSRT